MVGVVGSLVQGRWRLALYWSLVVALVAVLLPGTAQAQDEWWQIELEPEAGIADGESVLRLVFSAVQPADGSPYSSLSVLVEGFDGTVSVDGQPSQGSASAVTDEEGEAVFELSTTTAGEQVLDLRIMEFSGNATVRFVAPASDGADPAVEGFDDVPVGHVFFDEVAWLASSGITAGRGDGSFGVADPVTRGAMAAFLYRFEGEPDGPFDAPEFADVPAGNTFATEVAWLASTGITLGRGDGNFGISDPVTRGAMAAFLSRYDAYQRGEQQPAPDPDPDPDPDSSDGQAWTRLPHDAAVFGDVGVAARGLTAGGPGFVAVGQEGYERGAQTAAVWTSVDGRTWERVPHDDEVFGGEGFPAMYAVTTGGPGLVAVGASNDAPIWTSADGRTWERVASDPAVFGENGTSVQGVTAHGSGLVAVGSALSADDFQRSAAVWTSADGRTWQRVPDDAGVFGSDEGTRIKAVTVGGPGLVAVGEDFATDGAAVWTSVDGTSWERVPHDDDLFSSGVLWMDDVTVTPEGALIAVGGGQGQAVAWSSPDGRTWERGGVADADRAYMTSVAVGGPALVAVGGGEGGGAVWTSQDGASWQRVQPASGVFAGDPFAGMSAVATAGDAVVAVGFDGGDKISEHRVAVWTSP